jgi:hypothetical protein
MNTIKFENKEYEVKEITLDEIGSVLIGSESLCKELIPDCKDFKSDEARNIDEHIYFYVSDEILQSDNKSLTEYVERNSN